MIIANFGVKKLINIFGCWQRSIKGSFNIELFINTIIFLHNLLCITIVKNFRIHKINLELNIKHCLFSFCCWSTCDIRIFFWATNNSYTIISKWCHFFYSPNCGIIPFIYTKFGVTSAWQLKIIPNFTTTNSFIVLSCTKSHFSQKIFCANSINIFI